MFLNKVRLQNFRNYENLELNFSDKYNFLFGENAQGKSTFLEALFCLALGKSFYAGAEHEVVRWGQNNARINTQINLTNGGSSLPSVILAEINYAKQNGQNNITKNIRLNNKFCRSAGELIKNTFFIHFSPYDFNIIRGSSCFRRKFIDFLTAQLNPSHLKNLLLYNKCLIQRNILLKKGIHSGQLDAWSHQLVKLGSLILAKRLFVLNKFVPIFINTAKDFFMEDEKIILRYASTIYDGEAELPLQKITNIFAAKLNQTKNEEFSRRITLAGPQRDDFIITINEKNARQFASFGQKHSLALALKLAQARLINEQLNQNPILLLDDCFVGLDKIRQNKIWNMLKSSSFSQIFITSPVEIDLDLGCGNAAAYEVKSGNIVKTNLGEYGEF